MQREHGVGFLPLWVYRVVISATLHFLVCIILSLIARSFLSFLLLLGYISTSFPCMEQEQTNLPFALNYDYFAETVRSFRTGYYPNVCLSAWSDSLPLLFLLRKSKKHEQLGFSNADDTRRVDMIELL